MRKRACVKQAVWVGVVGVAVQGAAIEPASSTPRVMAVVPAPAGAIDPQAKATLTNMLTYLRQLPAFTVDADVNVDMVVGDGFKVQKTRHEHVLVRQPNRLRADVTSDDEGVRMFFYDGKAMTLYSPAENVYATAPAPSTLVQTLDVLHQRHGLELPLTDILYGASGGTFDEHITSGGVVGMSDVNGIPCQHIAFRTKAVDWQIWVERGPSPLPRKIVMTSRDQPTSPQSTVVLRWSRDLPVPDDAFHFTPPKGAMPISFEGRKP